MFFDDGVEAVPILGNAMHEGGRKLGALLGKPLIFYPALDDLGLVMTDTINFEKCL